MAERISVSEYFRQPEELRPRELVYGVLREPPAPKYGHQVVVTHLGALLDRHAREHRLGHVCVSPVDVVLDAIKALVLQPDIVFLSTARRHLVRDRIWGAPDLVVEVLSPGTARRDRTTKLRWYREHGVRECWIVDPLSASIEVVDLTGPRARGRVFTGESRVRSEVLPAWNERAAAAFE